MQPGQRVVIDLGTGELEVEIVMVPAGNVSKKTAAEYYRVVWDERGSVEW